MEPVPSSARYSVPTHPSHWKEDSVAKNTVPDYPAIIGRQLKRIRTRAGLTQLEIAEKCGLFRTYVSRIELGDANPTVLVLGALAASLDVDIGELLAEDLNP